MQCTFKMGHTDTLAIADAGLPIPASTKRIDLALTHGVPSFMQVFEIVSEAMQIEKITLAREIIDHNPSIHSQILAKIEKIDKSQGCKVEVCYLSHENFKHQTEFSKAIVRTGECSPYANIILHSGVIF